MLQGSCRTTLSPSFTSFTATASSPAKTSAGHSDAGFFWLKLSMRFFQPVPHSSLSDLSRSHTIATKGSLSPFDGRIPTNPNGIAASTVHVFSPGATLHSIPFDPSPPNADAKISRFFPSNFSIVIALFPFSLAGAMQSLK